MKSKHSFVAAGVFLVAITTGYGQPVITNQPRLLATALGTTATFTVGARGTAPLAYQWQQNLSDLPGRTNAVLSLTNVQISDQADYRVVVSDAGNSVTSAVAHLYVMSFAAVTARAVLDTFDDNRLTGWTMYGSGLLIESKQQFTVRGYWPGQHTTATYDTFCFGVLSTSYRTVGQGQTLEWRVDLIHLDDNATNAVKFILGTTSGIYGFFKWRDFIALDKYPITQASLFSFERASIRNTNVVLAFALTRVGLNVILTARVLDKDNPGVVLYERSVVDTPNSDPTLTTADVLALSGMHLAFGPEASGAPYTYAGAGIGLFQYTDGTRPTATVTYDNLELWTYRLPTAHYVDVNNASPIPPYTNWATAAVTIQDAVDAAPPGDEIVVTNGIYATGGRAVGTNVLVNGVAVDKPLTVRSVNGPQFTVIEGYQVPETTNGDGVVRCVYLASGASLSGFTLTNGATRRNGDSDRQQGGGGVWCESTDVMVSNCVVAANSAGYRGGGAWSGTLNNCTLTGNSAEGGLGGGVYAGSLNDCTVVGNSAQHGGGAYGSTLNNCTLAGNSADIGGGGANGGTLNNCTLTGNLACLGGGASGSALSNCTLSGNSASCFGGGASASTLNNCTLTRNSAQNSGGGAGGGLGGSCTLNNCTLSGNYARDGGGGAAGGTLNNCTLTGNSAKDGGGAAWGSLKNCIVCFNRAAVSGANYYAVSLNYCCTTPLPSDGSGNITVDPQLASASHLSASSPCRGAGSSAYATGVDIDGEAWDNPPSIGCDEYHTGAITGPLGVSIAATYTNVAVGFVLDFTGFIEGRTTVSVWDFGDGLVVSNRPYASHAWMTPGDYAVVLRAYNESLPGGVSATVTVHVVGQPVHYVIAGSSNPVPPYTSWATAAVTIQDAVDAALPGAVVLVTNGVYATGGRAVGTNILANRVAVDKPLTLRSVNGPQFTVIQGSQVPDTTNGGGAIRCVYLTSGASLCGFTLTNGATRTDEDYGGGGVWCESAAASVSTCVIAGNSAMGGGGAFGGTLIECSLRSNSASGPGGGAYQGTLSNCTLIGNSAFSGGGAADSILNNSTLSGNAATLGGGALDGRLDNCALSSNTATIYYGGGAHGATLNNCTLGGNSAEYGGGASESTLNNCMVTGNSALSRGGGAAASLLNNCTLTGNSACYGGGAAGYQRDYYSSTLNNCVVCFNNATNGANYDEFATLSYCCTTPLPTNGVGNITNAPLFVNYAGGNLRLQSNSPCINAGRNAFAPGPTDLDGNPRIVSGTVDIGAYEFQGPGSVISYAWLQRYGLPTDGSADSTDSDADGMNNWQEWRCQTDPTNPLSVLRLLSASRAGTNVTVSWQSVAGVSYFLERSTTLPSPFTLVATNILGQASTTTYTATSAAAAPRLFYRVGVGN